MSVEERPVYRPVPWRTRPKLPVDATARPGNWLIRHPDGRNPIEQGTP